MIFFIMLLLHPDDSDCVSAKRGAVVMERVLHPSGAVIVEGRQI